MAKSRFFLEHTLINPAVSLYWPLARKELRVYVTGDYAESGVVHALLIWIMITKMTQGAYLKRRNVPLALAE